MNLNSFVNSFRTITRTDAGINGDAQRIEPDFRSKMTEK